MMTFKEVAVKWVEYKREYVKLSTISAYHFLLINHVYPLWGYTDIEGIKSSQGQELYESLLGSGLSAKSAKDILIVVNMVFAFGCSNLNLGCPYRLCKVMTPKDSVPKKRELITYTPVEQAKIINYILEYPSFPALGLLIVMHSGLRIGEITGLRFGDIDLDTGVLRVSRTMQRIYTFDTLTETAKTQVVFGEPKTSSSRRGVPLARRVLALLKKYKHIVKDDYFICSGSLRAVEPRTYRNWYYEFLTKRVGLDRFIHFHGLRHTFATHLLSKGVDIKTTSSILGHSNITTTMNLYMHPSDDDKRKAVEKAFKKM